MNFSNNQWMLIAVVVVAVFLVMNGSGGKGSKGSKGSKSLKMPSLPKEFGKYGALCLVVALVILYLCMNSKRVVEGQLDDADVLAAGLRRGEPDIQEIAFADEDQPDEDPDTAPIIGGSMMDIAASGRGGADAQALAMADAQSQYDYEMVSAGDVAKTPTKATTPHGQELCQQMGAAFRKATIAYGAKAFASGQQDPTEVGRIKNMVSVWRLMCHE